MEVELRLEMSRRDDDDVAAAAVGEEERERRRKDRVNAEEEGVAKKDFDDIEVKRLSDDVASVRIAGTGK